MYRNENVSARTKSRLAKEGCFNRNIPILNILFYIGGGFMLRKQMVTLARIFYQINEHKANDMIADLGTGFTGSAEFLNRLLYLRFYY